MLSDLIFREEKNKQSIQFVHLTPNNQRYRDADSQFQPLAKEIQTRPDESGEAKEETLRLHASARLHTRTECDEI